MYAMRACSDIQPCLLADEPIGLHFTQHWQFYVERCPDTNFTLERHTPAVRLDEIFRNGHSQPGTYYIQYILPCLLKAFKHERLILWRNANARIFDLEANQLTDWLCCNRD